MSGGIRLIPAAKDDDKDGCKSEDDEAAAPAAPPTSDMEDPMKRAEDEVRGLDSWFRCCCCCIRVVLMAEDRGLTDLFRLPRLVLSSLAAVGRCCCWNPPPDPPYSLRDRCLEGTVTPDLVPRTSRCDEDRRAPV